MNVTWVRVHFNWESGPHDFEGNCAIPCIGAGLTWTTASMYAFLQMGILNTTVIEGLHWLYYSLVAFFLVSIKYNHSVLKSLVKGQFDLTAKVNCANHIVAHYFDHWN